MTDLESMAREAGLTDPDLAPWMTDYGNAEEAIKRFAALVRADERERCAKAAEAQLDEPASKEWNAAVKFFAAAIRALPPSL